MSPRTGRPPKGAMSRNVSLNIRVTEEEALDIEACAHALNVSRTDVIVHGIKMVKAELEKKK